MATGETHASRAGASTDPPASPVSLAEADYRKVSRDENMGARYPTHFATSTLNSGRKVARAHAHDEGSVARPLGANRLDHLEREAPAGLG